MEDGSVPSNWLKSRYKFCNEDIDDNAAGTVPDRWFDPMYLANG